MNWTRTHTVIAACVVAVGAAGLLLIPRGDAVGSGGPAVSIALVEARAPAPVMVQGGIMEVGEVVNGYDHQPAEQPLPYDPAPYDEYPDEPLPMPEPRRWVPQPSGEPQRYAPVVTVRADGRPLSFGFDEPQPDYAAQRRERQARMERVAEAQAMRVQTSSGAELDPEAEFY